MKYETEYLAAEGSFCPYCKSPDITGVGTFEADSNWVSLTIECEDCQKQWDDIYTLSNVEGRD